MTKGVSVFGLFSDSMRIERAVDALKRSGFQASEVSVLMADQGKAFSLAHVKHTKAPEGASVGASLGGITGGILGWLVGTGSLAIPAFDPFIAAGPILAAGSGLGFGGLIGGLLGFLIGSGVPEYEAVRSEGHVKNGGILISVHTNNRLGVKKATEVLKTYGAHHVASAGEEPGAVLAA